MMADRKLPVGATSCKRGSDRTRRFSHLKPLSIYARSVFRKAADSFSVSPSLSPDCPSWNLKVEFTNSMASVQRKRRSDDSCFDEEYDTPPKKPCLSNGSSPDSACDSHFRQVKLVSSLSSSETLDGIKRIEKTLSDQESLGLGWFNCIDRNKCWSSKSFPAVHSSSPLILHNKGNVDGITFNYDVDEIMCLSPINGPDTLEDFIQGYKTCEEQILAEVTRNSGQNQPKAESSLGKVSQTESDDGYVTKSFDKADSNDINESVITKSDQLSFLKSCKITIPNCSNDKTLPGSIPVVSTPVYKVKPLVFPNLNSENHSWPSPRIVSETVNASSSIFLNGYENLYADETEAYPSALKHLPQLSHFVNVNESKEGNVAFEGTSKSLVCPNQEKSFANQLKDDKDVPLVGQQPAASKATIMIGTKTDVEDIFENTLPLQFQEPEAVKAPAHQQPEKIAASEDQRNIIEDVSRPVGLYREKEWEKQKAAYVDSVKRHINENGEAGVMTELLHLMNTVANQGLGGDGRTWQHPSDLTRRNYRLRNSGRLLSLDEWQNMNVLSYHRFAKVPQVFKRSSVV